MNRIWNRNVLRYVDAWACRDGTPEDDEDKKKSLSDGSLWLSENEGGGIGSSMPAMMTKGNTDIELEAVGTQLSRRVPMGRIGSI